MCTTGLMLTRWGWWQADKSSIRQTHAGPQQSPWRAVTSRRPPHCVRNTSLTHGGRSRDHPRRRRVGDRRGYVCTVATYIQCKTADNVERNEFEFLLLRQEFQTGREAAHVRYHQAVANERASLSALPRRLGGRGVPGTEAGQTPLERGGAAAGRNGNYEWPC